MPKAYYIPYIPYTPRRKDETPKSTDILDYNDPLGINSVVDVLFNEAALNKKYPNNQDDIGWLDMADMTQRAQAAVGLFKDSTIKPIQNQGIAGIGAATINALQNLGETADILANPIKGAILDPEGMGVGFMRGLGTTSEGRRNYDYDFKTGNGGVDFVANIVAEVVSDPFNWVSFGAAAVGKNATKIIAEGTGDIITKGITPELTKEVGQVLTTKAIKEVSDPKLITAIVAPKELVTEDLLKTLFKSIQSSIKKNPYDIRKAVQEAFAIAKLPVYDDAARATADLLEKKISQQLVTYISDSTALKVAQKAGDVYKMNDNIQKALTYAVGVTSGTAAVPIAAKVIKNSPAVSYLTQKLNRMSKSVTAPDGTIPLNKMEDGFRIYAAFEKDVSNLKEMPKGIDRDIWYTKTMEKYKEETDAVWDIFNKNAASPKKALKELDDRFLSKTAGEYDLERYAALATDYGRRYNTTYFSEYADNLNAVRRLLTDNFIKPVVKHAKYTDAPKPEQYLSLLRTAFAENPKSLEDIGTDILSQPVSTSFTFDKREQNQVLKDIISLRKLKAGERATEKGDYAGDALDVLEDERFDALFQEFKQDSTHSFASIIQLSDMMDAVADEMTFASPAIFNQHIDRNMQLTQKTLTDFSHVVEYFLMNTKGTTAFQLLDNDSLNKIMLDIYKGKGLVQELLPYKDQIQHFTEVLQITGEGHTNYIRMLSMFAASKSLKELYPRLFDVIQTYSRDSLSDWVLYGKNRTKNFLDTLQSQLISADQKQRFSLDFVLDDAQKIKFAEYSTAMLKGRAGWEHDAVFDSTKVDFILSEDGPLAELGRELRASGKILYEYDLETLGIKGFEEQIIQIGGIMDGAITDVKIRVPEGIYPSEDLLVKQSHTEIIADGKAWFDTNYTKNPQAVDEREALLTWLGGLMKTEARTGRKVVLIGHNSDYFDTNFFVDRLRYHKISQEYIQYYLELEKVDTLVEMYKKAKLPLLAEDTKQEITSILNTYTMMRVREPSSAFTLEKSFVNTTDNTFFSAYRDAKATLLKGAETDVNATVGAKLRRIDQGQQDIVGVFGDLDTALSKTFTDLHGFKDMNSVYRAYTVGFNTVKKEFISPATDLTIGHTGAVHVMQLFADSKHLAQVGVKKGYDTDIVRRFFHVQDANILQRQAQMVCTRSLTKLANKVRFPERLLPYHAELNKAQELLLTFLGKTRLGLRNIKTDIVGTKDQYAMVRYLFWQAQSKAAAMHNSEALVEAIVKHPDADAMAGMWKFVRDPALLRAPELTQPAVRAVIDPDQQETWTRRFYELWKSDLYRDDDILRENMGSASSLENMVEDSVVLRGKLDMDGASAQASASLLLPIKDLDTQYEVLTEKLIPGIGVRDTRPEIRLGIVMEANGKTLAEMHQLAKLPPEKLVSHMWEHSFGIVTFSNPYKLSSKVGQFTETYILHFKDNKALYEAAGIQVRYDEVTHRLFLLLKNDDASIAGFRAQATVLRKAEYNVKTDTHKIFFRETMQDYKAISLVDNTAAKPLLDITDKAFNWLNTLTDGKAAGSLGDTISKADLDNIYKNIPEKFRKDAIPPEYFEGIQRFRTIRFNRSNIGPLESRKQIEPYVARNLMKNYSTSAQKIMHRLDDRLKFHYLFFDKEKSLAGEIYERFSDAEILEMIKHRPEYKLAGLIDIRGTKMEKMIELKVNDGIIMKQYPANTVADIAWARSQGAMLLPPQTYMEAWRTINDYSVSSKAMKVLNSYIIGPSKLGYLSTTGWLFRNLIDSAAKNMMLTKDANQFGNMARHMLETWRIYNNYNTVLKSVLAEGSFSNRRLDDFYRANPDSKISKEMFYLYHNALEQGATAGMTATEKAILDAKWKHKKQYDNLAEQVMDKVYENPWSNLVMTENTVIEQVMRLSGYTWELQHGANVDEAMQSVLKNHFDYSTKSIPMMYAEYFVPFLSFTTNNLVFWLDSVEKFGWLGTLYRDITTPIWNFDEYSNMELNNNRSLQYQVLAGNVVLSDNLVVKLNPSITDAIRMVTDPSEWYSRITPVVRLPAQLFFDLAMTGKSELLNDPQKMFLQNFPLIGPTLQRYWAADDPYFRGSAWKGMERVTDWAKVLPVVLPSIFGGAQRNYYFGYATSGTVYMTHSREKLEERVSEGAIAITPGTRALPGKPRTYQKKIYGRKAYAQRKYFKKPRKGSAVHTKKVYAKKTWATKAYMPTNYSYTVQARILANVRHSQMRMPGSFGNVSHIAPSLYRKIYSVTGRDIFKTRMIPMTQAYLVSRLRQDWAWFRR